jgi:hypothetical protein
MTLSSDNVFYIIIDHIVCTGRARHAAPSFVQPKGFFTD